MASTITAPSATLAPPPSEAAAPNLTDSTAHGFAWYTAQTVVFKFASFAGQLVLAYLLMPEAFGLIMLATVVLNFAGLIQSAGLREVLVRRQARFDRWASPGFWMSMALGLAASAFMVIVAPLASRQFSDPALTGLIWTLALCPPLLSLATVPTAALQIQLRFRLLAVLTGVWNLSQLALFVLLAWMGAEAYSFVASRILGAAVYAGLVWWFARPTIRGGPRVRRWRFLIGDSALLFGTAVIYCIIAQGDALVIGSAFTTAIAGVYFFGFTLSLQTLHLVTSNLESLLLPTLSRLQEDPVRQARAFLRATRVLATVVVPLCLMQAAAADPVIRLVFQEKWYESIPVVQVLSLGMAFLTVAMPTGSMILAQGRFKARLWLAIASLAVYFPCVLAGASLIGGIVGIAAGVAAFHMIIAFASFWTALRPLGISLPEIAGVMMLPLVIAAAAVAPAWILAQELPLAASLHWVRAPAIGAISLAIYLPLLRLALPDAWRELASIGDRLVVSRLRRLAAA